jgi:hypothetical protein
MDMANAILTVNVPVILNTMGRIALIKLVRLDCHGRPNQIPQTYLMRLWFVRIWAIVMYQRGYVIAFPALKGPLVNAPLVNAMGMELVLRSVRCISTPISILPVANIVYGIKTIPPPVYATSVTLVLAAQ